MMEVKSHQFAILTFHDIAAKDLDLERIDIRIENNDAVFYIFDTNQNKYIKSGLNHWNRRYTLTNLLNEGELYQKEYEKEYHPQMAIIKIFIKLNFNEVVKRIETHVGFNNRLLLKDCLYNCIFLHNDKKLYDRLINKLLKPIKYLPVKKKLFPKLMNFQERNVRWMINIEKTLPKKSLPYFDQNFVPIKGETSQVFYNVLRGTFGSQSPAPEYIRFQGGCLIDEMGCGKTACAVSLALAKLPKSINGLILKENRVYSRATLIVVPNHISHQWVNEITKFNLYKKYRPKIITISDVRDYRKHTYQSIASADFVIITYQYLFNNAVNDQLNKMIDYSHGANSHKYECRGRPEELELAIQIYLDETHGRPNLADQTHVNLLLFRWNRIILDECQEIMSGNYQRRWFLIKFMKSKYRWCLTGTPFDTLTNLTQIVAFLTHQSKVNWHHDFAFHILNEGIFRRNTIESTKHETPLKDIKLIEKTIFIEFTKQERLIYQAQINYHKSIEYLRQFCCSPFTPHELAECKTFDDIVALMRHHAELIIHEKSPLFNLIDQEYQNLLQNITNVEHPQNVINELRQRVDHLEKRRNNISQEIERANSSLKYCQSLTDLTKDKDNFECPICYGAPNNDETLSMTKCGHIFCSECLQETLNIGNNRMCPTCRTNLDKKDIFIVSSNEQEPELYKSVGSKISKLIDYIKETIKDPDNYIILFAEWESIMTKIGKVLQNYGINTTVCKGNKAMRESAIRRFNCGNNVRLIMLSSAYASHGTNLTKANKIIILNPVGGSKKHREDVEAQAIARSYRLGQTRDLEIVRFVIKNSIEESIYNQTMDDEDVITV